MFKRGDQPAPGKPAIGKPVKPGKGGKGTPAPRRHKRHMGKGKARCSLGDVLDISAGGMRIQCPGKPPMKAGAAATVTVRTSAGHESLNVRCCWVRRSGFFGKWQIGLKFIGITEAQAERLGIIAEYGFIPESKQSKPTDAGPTDAPTTPADAEKEAVERAAELAPHFAALELSPDADPDQVRNAYRRLVRTCHPDVCDSEAARAKFLTIQQSYDALRRGTSAGEQRCTQAA